MKKFALLIASILVILAVGCSTTKATTAAEPVKTETTTTTTTAAPEPVYGKYGIPMPEWVYKTPQDTDGYRYYTGLANLGNSQDSRNAAILNARNEIVQEIETVIKSATSMYRNNAGEGQNRQILDAYENLVISKVNMAVSGSREVESWESADGEYHTLVAIPIENLKAGVISSIDEAAAEPEFQRNAAAEEANNLMHEAIDRYFSGV